MITKPEDAIPHSDAQMLLEVTRHDVRWFSAAECAEIAKAYAYAFNGATASELPYPSVMKAIAEAQKTREAWEQRFAEWEKG